MFVTSAWLATLMYGKDYHCVLFGGCISVLLNRGRKTRYLLILSCTFHIAVSTAHILITFLELLKGSTSPSITSKPGGSDLYYVTPDPMFIAASFLYVCNIFAQDLLLIWRLYIVWGYNWKVVVVPLIGEAAHVACATTSVVLISRPMELFSPLVQGFGTASWTLAVIINTTVTCGIAYRLWRAGRDIGQGAAYKSTIYIVIESGALIASCTLVIFALDIAGSPAGFLAFKVAAQIATTTPLMIIARLGLGLTHGDVHSQDHTGKDTNTTVAFARPVYVTITRPNETCNLPHRAVSISRGPGDESSLEDVELGLSKVISL
ncbi:hypothetical protein HYDPIDRAFT_155887 [Hydnomerulius pinastri MD-312]|uniref:Integral membrane protein n=1 Tax=Hydnomerulius pinastri MD-312 TaxID=994086 RepID=A0A0C9WEV7_9AGAM|nr:hypothetical protein HYDPIDRAFT_155887 [Hydnomerulius pinastri MD-312]